MDETDVARLTGSTSEASGLPTFKMVMLQTGLSHQDLWQQVVEGLYLPYRVRHGQTWQWHLKDVQAAAKPTSQTVRPDRKGGSRYE